MRLGGRDTLDIRLIWVYNRRMKTQDEAPTKSFSIRVSVEMLDALRQVAKHHNRSIHGEILTALSDQDRAGHTIKDAAGQEPEHAL